MLKDLYTSIRNLIFPPKMVYARVVRTTSDRYKDLILPEHHALESNIRYIPDDTADLITYREWY